jgi:hypothetical protein
LDRIGRYLFCCLALFSLLLAQEKAREEVDEEVCEEAVEALLSKFAVEILDEQECFYIGDGGKMEGSMDAARLPQGRHRRGAPAVSKAPES